MEQDGLTRRRLLLGTASLLHAPETVFAAAAFADSVGVCVHLDSPPYRDRFEAVYRAIAALGVRHLRDELRPDNDLARWRRLYDGLGVRSHLLVSPATNTVAEMLDYLRAVGVETVSAIEGQNEGNSPWFMAQEAARPDWAASVNTYQRAVYQAVRSRDPSATLPVLSPSLLDYKPEDVGRIAPSAPFCDVVSIHPYVQGRQEPETTDDYAGIGWYLAQFRDRFKPGAPAMATEAGYHTGAGGVSQAAAAKYLPRLLLHAFSAGVRRTFLYELMDEGDDPADPEQRYGLISPDGAPKPAFYPVRMLLAALADPAPAQPQAAPVAPLDGPRDLRLLMFAKLNGDAVVALWRAARSWDPATNADRIVAPAPVHLRLLRDAGTIATLRLEDGHGWMERTSVHRTLRLDIDGTVCLLRLRR